MYFLIPRLHHWGDFHRGHLDRAERRPQKLPEPIGSYELSLEPDQLEYVQEVMQLCQERGIRVVGTSHFTLLVHRGLQAAFASQIRKALAGSGVQYLDFASAKGSTDMDNYGDEHHLNAPGARLFTGQLVDSLESIGYLK